MASRASALSFGVGLSVAMMIWFSQLQSIRDLIEFFVGLFHAGEEELRMYLLAPRRFKWVA